MIFATCICNDVKQVDFDFCLQHSAMANWYPACQACLALLCLSTVCSNAQGTLENSTSPIWCPESYRPYRLKGFLFHVCLPMSCAKTSSLDTEDASSSCQPFSATFKTCQKVFLDSEQHTKDSNGTVYSKLDKSYIQPGDYFFQLNKTSVCIHGAALSPNTQSAATPIPCMPFEVSEDGYAWQSNTTVFISSVNDTVPQGYYQLDSNGSVVTACYQKEFPVLDCWPRIIIDSDKMAILPTMALNTNYIKDIVYPLGSYALVEDRAFALVCVPKYAPVYQGCFTVKMYGAAALISAVFLLMALLAHLFFPRINYHTKALLCLAFSLLVMYIVVCIRNFGVKLDFTRVGNMVIFALQYIFALSSFFWLNVLAFDLWRVFSNQNMGTRSIASMQERKRWFQLKFAYAYGTPVLMCAFAIGISFSQTVQQTLSIYMVFDNNNWLQGEVGILALFYGPVTAILVSNSIFFVLTVKNIRKARSGATVLRSHSRHINVFKIYVKLYVIMGLSWFAETIYFFAKDGTHETVWYIPDIINMLQGVFIFLVYVCKKTTLIKIKNRITKTLTKTMKVSQESRLTTISSHTQVSQQISTIFITPMPENVQVRPKVKF